MSINIESLLEKYSANPKDFETTYNLGVYYLKNDLPQKAIKYFEEALILNKEFEAEIKYGLAISYRGINKEKGKQLLDEALSLKPELEGNFYLGSKDYY